MLNNETTTCEVVSWNKEKDLLNYQVIVNDYLFPIVKFVTKEAHWQYHKPLPKMIMDNLNIAVNKREKWWEKECKKIKVKFNRKRNNCGRKIREVMEGKHVIGAPNGFVILRKLNKLTDDVLE